jgi:hypothetical protein
VKDDLGYDPTRLKNGLDALNKNAGIGLIVTIGGLVTLYQAVNGATNYFISIFGGRNGVPSAGTGYFLGGVCLQSYNRNPLRIAKVKSKFNITSDDELCLLSNPNSSMANIEKNGWVSNRYVSAAIDPGTADPLDAFRQAFTDVVAITNPKIKAVIVSADPYFFSKGSALVQAAKEWIDNAPAETRVVCYPLQDYSAYGPKKHLLHGPDLKKAYKDLGKKARKILTSTGSPTGTIEDAIEDIN